MDTDLEELLRQGIDRLSDQVPADLADRAARRARRHRLAAGTGVAAAAAGAAAAIAISVLSIAPTASKPTSTVIAQSGGSPPTRPTPTEHPLPLPTWPSGPVTHAMLVSRVEHAVLTSTNYIAYSQRYDYSDRSKLIVSAWDYRNRHLLIQADPHNAQLTTNYPDRHTVKAVDYEQRTWTLTRWPWSGVIPTDRNQCVGPADDSPQVGDPRWAAWLVSSLRCGAYTVTRHSGAKGTTILNIVNTPKDVEYQHGVRLHILVDAATYLPIADWQAGDNGFYDVIKWLPPTHELLKQLTLPVPPGFSGP